jgi:hypothetical protein
MTYFTWEMKTTKITTRLMIDNLPFLYYEKGDLGKFLKYFTHVLIKYSVPETLEFIFIHDIEAAYHAKKRANNITNIYEF